MPVPAWPAIIQYSGVDELGFVRGQQQWNTDTGLTEGRYTDADLLIDSLGQVYAVARESRHAAATLRATGQTVSPQQLSDAVQKHLSAASQCCVSKILLNSYAECIALVEKTAQQ